MSIDFSTRVLPTRFLSACVMTAALATLAGCSMFSDSDPRYEPAKLTEFAPAVSARIAWQTAIGSGAGVGFAPVVIEEGVYAATPNGSVAKLSLASGAVLWRATIDRKLSAGVGSDGRTTAVAAPDGSVIAFNDQGAEKWRAQATSEVLVPPAVGYGVVVVRSGDYRIQAFDADSGELRWSVQRPGPALALKASMQMRMIDGMVITGLPSGKLIAIDVGSGSVQWEGTVSVSQGATDLDRISDIVGMPQFQEPMLCAVAYQGRMACFDIAQGGITAWWRRFSSHSGMTVDGQRAYASDQRSVMHAFALADGEPLWSQEALRNRALSAPAAVRNSVAVGDFEGYVHLLDAHDGTLQGRLHLAGGAIVSPLMATARGVLVQTGKGDLVLVGLN